MRHLKLMFVFGVTLFSYCLAETTPSPKNDTIKDEKSAKKGKSEKKNSKRSLFGFGFDYFGLSDFDDTFGYGFGEPSYLPGAGLTTLGISQFNQFGGYNSANLPGNGIYPSPLLEAGRSATYGYGYPANYENNQLFARQFPVSRFYNRGLYPIPYGVPRPYRVNEPQPDQSLNPATPYPINRHLLFDILRNYNSELGQRPPYKLQNPATAPESPRQVVAPESAAPTTDYRYRIAQALVAAPQSSGYTVAAILKSGYSGATPSDSVNSAPAPSASSHHAAAPSASGYSSPVSFGYPVSAQSLSSYSSASVPSSYGYSASASPTLGYSAVGQSASSYPASASPALGYSAVGQSASSYPASASPALGYSAVGQSASRYPASASPALGYSAVGQSASSYPASASPALGYSAVGQSASSYPASASPALGYSAVGQSASSYPASAPSASNYPVPAPPTSEYSTYSALLYPAAAQPATSYSASAQSTSGYSASAQSLPNYSAVSAPSASGYSPNSSDKFKASPYLRFKSVPSYYAYGDNAQQEQSNGQSYGKNSVVGDYQQSSSVDGSASSDGGDDDSNGYQQQASSEDDSASSGYRKRRSRKHKSNKSN